MNSNLDYYDNSSRYFKNIEITKINVENVNKAFPLMLDNIKFTNEDIRFFYIVDQNEEGRIDLISNKVYGNTKLWWAIALANLIEDLMISPKAGDILKIPSLTALERYI
jgi:hypothetical protein